MSGDVRLFGTVVRVSHDGTALVHRLDDRGDVRVPAKAVVKAGGLQSGDVIEFRIWPPGDAAGDVLLVRRAKHLVPAK